MSIWQADFYRRPLQDATGSPLWELVICDPNTPFTATAFCPQSTATIAWITRQLQQLAEQTPLPDRIQVFRPQAASLLHAACQPLGIGVEPTRRTPALKHLLQQRSLDYRTMPNYTGQAYDPLALDRPPPVPLPENLWGDQWRFAAIPAQDLLPALQHRPIPITDLPEALWPIRLNLPSTLAIPGVVMDAGRRSMPLAQWIQRVRPVALTPVPGAPDGLILEAGLVERWVLTTFDDPEVAAAGRLFQQRQQAAQGLHFLLIEPDDSGMTYTAFWLLQATD